jgi:hypothetical protein
VIVDPNSTDAKLTAEALRRVIPDASVIRVLHADQASRILFERGLWSDKPESPRLLVVDAYALAEGEAWLERVCWDEKTREVPVIVHSFGGNDLDVEAISALGISAFVAKNKNHSEYRMRIEMVAAQVLSMATSCGRSADPFCSPREDVAHPV